MSCQRHVNAPWCIKRNPAFSHPPCSCGATRNTTYRAALEEAESQLTLALNTSWDVDVLVNKQNQLATIRDAIREALAEG